MGLELRGRIALHLRHNCYPSVPTNMVSACESAIALVKDGEGQTLVELPEGVLYKDQRVATAQHIVYSFYLEDFIEEDTNA